MIYFISELSESSSLWGNTKFCLWTGFTKAVMCVSSRSYLLKFPHFKERLSWSLGLVSTWGFDKLLCHLTGSSVISGIYITQRFGLLLEDLIPLQSLMLGNIPVKTTNKSLNGSRWSVWNAVSEIFRGKVDLGTFKLRVFEPHINLLSEGILSLSCGCTILDCYLV
jgi:hypothetical protein